jgi:ureidoglycolate dehydrogenase (NAD+)
MRYFEAKALAGLMEGELARRDVAPESIRHVVASLIQTSLRGTDSHGINLFPHYCRAVEAGRINARPSLVVNRTGTSVAVVDADHGFGHHCGAVAMELAIVLAKESGMAAVNVRNSTHFGAASYFGLMAPEHDCIGFAFTNADALVQAFGSPEAFFGTNPVCFTAPMEKEGPFCLDMATSLVSWNKINNYRRENMDIPGDWAFDAEGNSVEDPHRARCLNPIGGYKGFGLGMMVDILCSTLAGGINSKDMMAMYAPPLDSSKRCVSHFFMAFDISRFIDPLMFSRSLQLMAELIRALPKQDPQADVMVAGDPEKLAFLQRSAQGIPVDEAKFSEFLDLNPSFSTAVLS